MISKITLISTILIVLLSGTGLSQELFTQGLKLDAGFGIHAGSETDGLGTIISLGYERTIWTDRIRINPFLSYGKFKHSFATDTPQQNLISRSISAAMSFDIVRFWILSLTLAVGGTVDNTNGVVGPGGESQPNNIENVNEWATGIYFSGGVRINTTTGRFALEITPLANSMGHNLLIINSTIGIVLRF